MEEHLQGEAKGVAVFFFLTFTSEKENTNLSL